MPRPCAIEAAQVEVDEAIRRSAASEARPARFEAVVA
jgi:hypothetical protein